MGLQKLTDRQMQDFIRTGYVLVKPNLPDEFHQAIFRQTETVFETEFNPGNNLLPRIPALRNIFDDPVVSGALTSVLGPSYFMWPHRHCHYNAPGTPAQNLHKDAGMHKGHRTRRIFALYYPQETTLEMGPTAVLPGSYIYNTRPTDDPAAEVALVVEAGTVAIAEYDIWHGATENRSDKKRYMMKFLFDRIEEPTCPSWDSEQAEWSLPSDEPHHGLRASQWAWHSGQANGAQNGHGPQSGQAIADLIAALSDDSEMVAIDAAYELGEIGAPAASALIEALPGQDEETLTDTQTAKLGNVTRPELVRRNASYALSAMGAAAVPALIEATKHPQWWVREIAVQSLGDTGLAAEDAIPALIEALQDDSSDKVRPAAAEALGTTSQAGSKAVTALAQALEQDNAGVRNAASLALARIGQHAQAAVPALQGVFEDENRYTRGHAVHALYRIGTPPARAALLDYLLAMRWCSITTKESLY